MSWPNPDEDAWEEPSKNGWHGDGGGAKEGGWEERGERNWEERGEGNWEEHGEGGWEERGEGWDSAEVPCPLDWRGLYPRERWLWFNRLWCDACLLRDRYRLALRAGWWENDVQVEALAALSAWVARYDSGEWDDPPGKLALLFDLERVSALLRDGGDPFSPRRDRPAFERHLTELGCQPPLLPDEGPWSS